MQYSNSKLPAWYSTSIAMHRTCQQKKRAAKQEDIFISVRHQQTQQNNQQHHHCQMDQCTQCARSYTTLYPAQQKQRLVRYM
eukprot:6434165-Ditylum_brightwellii.AAC.1